MARPKLNADEIRKKWISVRVNESEYEQIKSSAKSLALSASDYLRKLGLNTEIKIAPPTIDRDTYRQIAGIAKNINQMVTQINTGVYSEVPSSYYEGLKKMISEIGLKVLK